MAGVVMEKSEITVRLEARLAELQAVLRQAEDQALAVRGGIAELELLLSQVTELPAADSEEQA
jgi:small-conductance mechanosensitive channel